MRSKASLGERLSLPFKRRGESEVAAPVVAEPEAVQPEPGPPEKAKFLLFDPSFAPLLRRIDEALPGASPERALALFADLPLDLFVLLAAHRPPEYPNLAAWLPRMPPPDVQLGFTGAEGEVVMFEAAAFVGALARLAGELGVDLARAWVLDYGVGWGRVSRLLYRFVPGPQVCGVDAWPGSLEVAEGLGLKGPLALIDEQPERLPFERPFDVVCAFSVFTHLNEPAMKAALGAIRSALRLGGLLAVTIRPMDIWRLYGADAALAERHRDAGFAFHSDAGPGAVYGDASMTLDYVRREWNGFEVAAVEVNGGDPYQIMVLLKAV